MKYQFCQLAKSALFTLGIFAISLPPVQAAPGNLGRVPLFIAPPVQPNIFFMLDDSGSMFSSLQRDKDVLIDSLGYDITPDSDPRLGERAVWLSWCLGANVLAYNPDINYKPWAGNQPGTSIPYPDQNTITNVWSEPTTVGFGFNFPSNFPIFNFVTGSVDLSNAPVVRWNDAIENGGDGDGEYDEGECPFSFDEPNAVPASTLSLTEQTNFANWFAYYRNRDRTVTAAVSEIISTSSTRMGMATLHHNNNVGKPIKDMTVTANKIELLNDIAHMRPSGITPLRKSLNLVGKYFNKSSSTPRALNIGSDPSPILSASDGGECQQNFVMLMTDGDGNGEDSNVGHKDKTVDNNFVYKAHKDNYKDTLADVAMKWYKTDLAPGLANKVPVQSGNEAQNLDQNNKQHLVTFTVAFGLSGGLSADPLDRREDFSWPEAGAGANTKVGLSDLRHAAYNGRGKFLSANDPVSLVRELQNIISDIESREGSASVASFNSSILSAGTSLFFASFDTIGWKGNLRAFSVNVSTGELSASPLWDAADELNSLSNVEALDRTIYTLGRLSATEIDGVLLNWRTSDPQPAGSILDDFKVNQDLSIDVAPFNESQDRLDFIHGDTSNNNTGLFRDRASRLGDIIHSAPIYVAEPLSKWPEFSGIAQSYSQYVVDQGSRAGIVYVGANDGLLHAFRASDGVEVFSYLPSVLASSDDNTGFHYLTESDYQHQYYVDGLPAAADVFMPIETAGAAAWRTLLIGSLGGGGRGLYALNITDPSQFDNTQEAAKRTVLWEFTDQDDDHLGFSFSAPQVARMNNGKWAVIVGNGYNATGTDTAELFIIFIEEGVDGVWSAGDYLKIDTTIGTGANKNGLSTPTLIDLDGNGTTDRVYAGDLLGNMWAFDVSDSNVTQWDIPYKTGSIPEPLFTATHHAGDPVSLVSSTPQPITMKPLLVQPEVDWVADGSSHAPNVMVYFGTGQYIAMGDASNTNHQTFYGVWDAGHTVTPSDLVEQTFVAGFPIDSRVLTQNPVTLASPTQMGWFINLPETGERVVVDAFEFTELIFFNTLTPSSDPCSAGGDSWRMAVDMKTGGNPDKGSFDIDGNGEFNDSDKVSDGSDDFFVAGKRFGHGIASATAVITNSEGKSFSYTSATGTGSGSGAAGGVIKDDMLGSTVTGKRRSWIQLFQ